MARLLECVRTHLISSRITQISGISARQNIPCACTAFVTSASSKPRRVKCVNLRTRSSREANGNTVARRAPAVCGFENEQRRLVSTIKDTCVAKWPEVLDSKGAEGCVVKSARSLKVSRTDGRMGKDVVSGNGRIRHGGSPWWDYECRNWACTKPVEKLQVAVVRVRVCCFIVPAPAHHLNGRVSRSSPGPFTAQLVWLE